MFSRIRHLSNLGLFFLFTFNLFADIPNYIDDGILLFQKGDYKEAKVCFQRLLERDCNNWKAIVYLGRIHFTENKLDEAEKLFQKAIAIEENDSYNHFWLAVTYGEKAKNAGIFKAGSLAKKMKTSLLKSIELDPDNIDARDVLIQFYVSAPKIMGGSMDKAQEQADEINKRDPFKGLCSYGWIYSSKKNHEKALKNYLQALELTKLDTSNLRKNEVEAGINDLGYEMLSNGDTFKAIQVFQVNVENFPESLNVYDSLGEAYAKSGNKKLAISFYRKAVEMNPRKTEWEKKMYESGVKQIEKLGGTI